jgi:hypothetical protein
MGFRNFFANSLGVSEIFYIIDFDYDFNQFALDDVAIKKIS